MMFDDMKEFYERKGFLDSFYERGYTISYPEDDLYISNHLVYLINLANKYHLDYSLSGMSEDVQVNYLEYCIDCFFSINFK